VLLAPPAALLGLFASCSIYVHTYACNSKDVDCIRTVMRMDGGLPPLGHKAEREGALQHGVVVILDYLDR
jgi:hypothetical protein